MSRKIRVGVLFGGRSAEHEVSLQSARNVVQAIDREKYEVVPIGIDRAGRWFLEGADRMLEQAADSPLVAITGEHTADMVTPVPTGAGSGHLMRTPGGSTEPLDVIFPVLHGPMGEDGTVQGLLRLADIPFVGSGVLASAVGMDKDVAKRLMRDAGIPIARFVTLRRGQPASFAELSADLGTPLFIKPANMGSSVGVSRVEDAPAFDAALKDAFDWDHRVLVEEYIQGREIECSVLGNEAPEASVPGEVIPHHTFYSYEAKYLDADGAGLSIPADLPEDVVAEVQRLAVETFQVLGCEGMARVDLFLRGERELFINEVNTIPGFTRISMYPKLWEASGLPYPALIDRLITLALERAERDRALRTSFQSS